MRDQNIGPAMPRPVSRSADTIPAACDADSTTSTSDPPDSDGDAAVDVEAADMEPVPPFAPSTGLATFVSLRPSDGDSVPVQEANSLTCLYGRVLATSSPGSAIAPSSPIDFHQRDFSGSFLRLASSGIETGSTLSSQIDLLVTPFWWRDYVQRPVASFMVVSTVGLLGFAVFQGMLRDWGLDTFSKTSFCQDLPTEQERYAYVIVMTASCSIQMVVSLVVASAVLWAVSSRKLWRVIWFMVLAWTKASLNFLYGVTNIVDKTKFDFWIHTLTVLAHALFVMEMYLIVLHNTETLENATFLHLGANTLKWLGVLIAPFTITSFTIPFFLAFYREGSREEDVLSNVFGVCVWSIVAIMAAGTVIATRATVMVWSRVIEAATRATTTDDKEEAFRARRVCAALMVCTGTGLVTSFLNIVTRFILFRKIWPFIPLTRFAHSVAMPEWVCQSNMPIDLVDTLSNISLILVTSGIFTGALRRIKATDAYETRRKRKRRRLIMRPEVGMGRDWGEVVDDLATRGFTLEALLRFYRGLGREYMQHYDPERSTTKDVVRGAIIPLSRQEGCALATLMMGRAPTRPQVFVTHTWESLFSDTVSAIVADALDDSCYEFASRMLNQHQDELERLLASRGVLRKTYWVCAFSINQHSSICSSSRTTDSVTGLRHPTCDCNLPKYWNETPPLTTEGRSIRCEMNKFDDMVGRMAQADGSFYQVLAMDRALSVLSRCWCVAEIVEAFKSGMIQSIKAFSPATLRARKDDLAALRVEDMSASRREDVDEILSKIPDKEAFNKTYRAIVEDTITQFQELPITDKIRRAGRFWLHSVYCT